MKFKAYLNFFASDDDGNEIYRNSNLPVVRFQVDGGTSRIINLGSTDDFSLVSELEQARSFTNLYIHISSNMKAAMDLTALARDETTISLLFIIERYSGGKLLEGLGLYCPNGVLKFPPVLAGNDTLATAFDLVEGTEIYRGKIRNHYMPMVKEL